jgi:carbamoyltransferase
MNILGINAFHADASAALVCDGQLVAAAEEERFNRIKHWAGFPAQSIRFCLDFAGLRPQEIDHVAVSFDPRANLARRVAFVLWNRPSVGSLRARFARQRRAVGLKTRLARALDCDERVVKARLHHVEHHLAHMALGFLASPFEDAAILSVDGMGDFVSTVLATGQGEAIRVLDRVYYPHSLGFLYNALTLYLGFPHYGDEYKVMGLAPYGEPEFLDLFRRLIVQGDGAFELDLAYFTHGRKGISMTWDDGAPVVDPFHSPRLESLLGPPRQPGEELTPRHQNIAASLQAVTEEALIALLEGLHHQTGCPRLCVTGGVAMNSVANGKYTQRTPFRDVYVPVGAADNGTAIGAAFHVWNGVLGQPRGFQLDHAYWGPEFSDIECSEAIRAAGLEVRHYELPALIDRVVDLIAEGKVVGWYQGRMEFGARALGNRSLLADPRRADMRDIINLRIKFREKFRPFAPSILEERTADYFEQSAPSPFMEKVFQVRPNKREQIPAVTHVDGSGRLQTVSRRTNRQYWDLIRRFENRTGIPLVLNTSLNENEPIVRSPGEALSCFRRTRMDAMALGSHLIMRVPHEQRAGTGAGS